MRFGVSAFAARDAASWRRDAQQFERAGFDVLWVPDHVGIFDPFVALSAAAQATTRLRVGTYVLNVELWNPLLLARAAATTDVLSDGRLVLGLGAGHAEVEFAQAGLRYPSPAERVGRLERFVPVLRRLLDGETVDDEALGLKGASTGLTGSGTTVPILVGGNGARVLRLAARSADIAGLTGFTSGTGQTHSELSHWTWAGLSDRIALVEAATEGTRPVLDVLVQRVAVTEDRADAVQEFVAATSATVEAHLDSPFLLIGTREEIRAQLDRMESMGVGRVTVFRRDADALATVIASQE